MKIAVVAFPGFQMLDLAGPLDVFHEGARQAGQPDAYQFEIIAPGPGMLTASNGMRIEPDATLETASDDIDTLLVAGGPARAGMSTRNFARVFRQECQVTPADFVEAARIDAARRLLEGSRHPLKRVAALAGFGDPNNLRRAFLRRVGVAPSDYRRRFLNMA